MEPVRIPMPPEVLDRAGEGVALARLVGRLGEEVDEAVDAFVPALVPEAVEVNEPPDGIGLHIEVDHVSRVRQSERFAEDGSGRRIGQQAGAIDEAGQPLGADAG